MNTKSILYLNLIIYLLLFSLNCERRFIVTEYVKNPENQFIVGFAGIQSFPNTIVLRKSYIQSFLVFGYENATISVKLDTFNISEKENFSCREFRENYKLYYNQNITFHFKIDELTGIYSDIIPDTIIIKNYQTGDTISTDQPLLLEWNNVRNTDYYLINYCNTEWDDTPDSTFITTETNITIPYEKIRRVLCIYIYAISGLASGITNESNIQGDLNGRVYLYSQTCIEFYNNVITIIGHRTENQNYNSISKRFLSLIPPNNHNKL